MNTDEYFDIGCLDQPGQEIEVLQYCDIRDAHQIRLADGRVLGWVDLFVGDGFGGAKEAIDACDDPREFHRSLVGKRLSVDGLDCFMAVFSASGVRVLGEVTP